VKHLIFIMFVCVGFHHFLNITHAQTIILEPQAPIEDILNSDELMFQFRATEGQLLTFLAESMGDDFDPILRIENLNGTVLIENDDYNYPISKDALISGFTAPATGDFNLILSGYDGSTGSYRLTLYHGYSDVIFNNEFRASGSWQLIETPASDEATLNFQDDALVLGVNGIQQRVVVSEAFLLNAPYFVELDIRDIQQRNGWQVGIGIHWDDNDDHYSIWIDQRGFWRILEVLDGEETILRDWTPHPAIEIDRRDFTLGILVLDNGFDVLYNGATIGTIQDILLEQGAITLMAQTVNALNSEVIIEFENLQVSQPKTNDDNNIIPSMLPMTTRNQVIRALQRQLMIPMQGELFLTLDNASTQFNQAGVSRINFDNNVEYTDFIIGATFDWQIIGEGNGGCGIVIHNQADDADQYILAFIDQLGGYGISERNGEQFVTTIFDDKIIEDGQPNNLLLISQQGTIHLYVQNQYIGMIESTLSGGEIGGAVINYDTVDTSCNYSDFWVWRIN